MPSPRARPRGLRRLHGCGPRQRRIRWRRSVPGPVRGGGGPSGRCRPGRISVAAGALSSAAFPVLIIVVHLRSADDEIVHLYGVTPEPQVMLRAVAVMLRA